MTWNIVSDSSCDLRTASFHSSCVRFETVPLRIQVGGREFVDDDALSVPALLSAMAVEKAASSSACPSPADFAGARCLIDNYPGSAPDGAVTMRPFEAFVLQK